jgi:hypothetical protein
MNIDRAPFEPDEKPVTVGQICAGSSWSLVAIILGFAILAVAIAIGHYEVVLTAGMP